MYFNAQRVRKPGLRTTNHGRASTYPVSHNGGRVTAQRNRARACLSRGLTVRLQVRSRLVRPIHLCVVLSRLMSVDANPGHKCVCGVY
jgi:hypothetical protein